MSACLQKQRFTDVKSLCLFTTCVQSSQCIIATKRYFFGFFGGSRPLSYSEVLSILTLFNNPVLCPSQFRVLCFFCTTPSDLEARAVGAYFNSHIRTNPQFSIIRRKRHVVRTERGNRKLRQKKMKKEKTGRARACIKTRRYTPRTNGGGLPPTAVPNFMSATTFLSTAARHARSTRYYALWFYNGSSRLTNNSHIIFAFNFAVVIDAIFFNYNGIIYKII